MACGVDAESHDLLEEVQLLQAIYIHELEFQGPETRPTSLTLFLHPSTGDDDHTSKYVCLSLHLVIPEEYPNIIPEIFIQNPRGLSEAHIDSIQENLVELAKDKTGSSMLFDLIEYTKDCLTDNNIPSCACVICLEHFEKELGSFIKTKCYHYFHSVCLQKYIRYSLNEDQYAKVLCPMCRREIDDVGLEIEIEQIVSEDIVDYKPDEKEQEAQKERQRIFDYQKAKNGIINVEEERNKYLIEIKHFKPEFGSQGDVQLKLTSVASVVSGTGQNETVKVEERVKDREKEGLQFYQKGRRDWAGNSGANSKNVKENRQPNKGSNNRDETRKEYPRRRKPRGKQNKGKENCGGPGIVVQEGIKTNCSERESGEEVTRRGKRDQVENEDKNEDNINQQRENLDRNNQREIKNKDSGQTVHKYTMVNDDKVMANSCCEEHHDAKAKSDELKTEKETPGTSLNNTESQKILHKKNIRKRSPRKPRGDPRIVEAVAQTLQCSKGCSPSSKNERKNRTDQQSHSGTSERRESSGENVRTNVEATKEFQRKAERRNSARNKLRKNNERTNFQRNVDQMELPDKTLGKHDEISIEFSDEKYDQMNQGGGGTSRKWCRPPPGFERMYENKEKGGTNQNK